MQTGFHESTVARAFIKLQDLHETRLPSRKFHEASTFLRIAELELAEGPPTAALHVLSFVTSVKSA